MKIIISINPEHVANILTGYKTYEFRKKGAKRKVQSMLIYETAPSKKVVAEVEVLGLLEDYPEKLWERTRDGAGISREFYDAYFEGRKVAYAYKLGKVQIFSVPKKLSEYGVKAAPQSFAYIGSMEDNNREEGE